MAGASCSVSGALAAQDAAVFVQLAAAAMGDLSSGVILPSGWSQLTALPAPSPPSPDKASGPQGFYALGTLPSQPGTTIVVLALGLPWVTFLNNFCDGVIDLGAAPPGVMPSTPTPSGSPVVSPFSTAYSTLRAAIWSNVSRAAGNPLYIVGMSLGGPLAQLAALDLRPGNTGPSKEVPPAAQPGCYVFSSPAPGDSSFSNAFGSVVAESCTVGLGRWGVPVDLFPTAPGSSEGIVPVGTAQTLIATIPSPFDDPWVERSPSLYGSLLGDTPLPPPQMPGSLKPLPLPGGFDPMLAASLATLCTVPYQLAQHPGLLLPGSIAPFTLQTVVTAGGSPWAVIFVSPSSVVVAFRGTGTWAELGSLLGNSNLLNARFLDAKAANVHAGALGLYTTSTCGSSSAVTFRDALRTLLDGPLVQGRTLYFAGHDLGGALAVIAAADIATNDKSLGKPITYTFGSSPVGNFDFAQFIASLLTGSVFMIARPGDFLPSAMMSGAYERVGTAITLEGVPPNDEPTLHALTGYVALLNPFSPTLSGTGFPG